MDNDPAELTEPVQPHLDESYWDIPAKCLPKKPKEPRPKTRAGWWWAIAAFAAIFILPPAAVGAYALGIRQELPPADNPPDFSDLLPSNYASATPSTSDTTKASAEPGLSGRQTTPEPPTNCSGTLAGDDVSSPYIHSDPDGGFTTIEIYVNSVGQFCGTYDVTPGFPAICKNESRTYAIRGIVTENWVMITETHNEKSLFDGGGEGRRVALPGATTYTRETDALKTADGSVFVRTTSDAVNAANDRVTQSMDRC